MIFCIIFILIIELDKNISIKHSVEPVLLKKYHGLSPLFSFEQIFCEDFWKLLEVI